MKDVCDLIKLSIFLSISVIFLSAGGLGRKIMELGWENFVDT